MKFVKMQALGNDYVYLDAVNNPGLAERPDLPELARRISDRNTGIGADGLILVCRPTRMYAGMAHVRMRMFNADGSESAMCGNGIRCVAKFAHDRLGVRAKPMLVEAGGHVLTTDYTAIGGRLVRATVDMGAPVLDLPQVPVDASHLTPSAAPDAWILDVLGRDMPLRFVSMGNPHAVAFVSDVQAVDLERLGPAVESHPAFPARINFHVATPLRDRVGEGGAATEVRVRTWERGSGLTRACGTGACAVVVAGVRAAKLATNTVVHLPGGELSIAYDVHGRGRVLMTGPAESVFEGEYAIEATA